MNADTAKRICKVLKEKDLHSLHIGGGEAFLNFNGLLKVIEAVNESEISIEYVETNGFWVSDEKKTEQYLRSLKENGVDRLLISLDAFHAEYIPVGYPLHLADVCKNFGIKPIVWRKEFEDKINNFDKEKIHSRNELEKLLSPNYILEYSLAYQLQFNGRAINIEKEYYPSRPLSEIVANSKPCYDIRRTDGVHVDLHGNYLMSWCAVIAIPIEEAVRGLPKDKYPIIEILLSEGVGGLLKYAENQGFQPNDGYTSHCALCFHIRHWLSETGKYPELYPEYFREALAFY